MRTSIRRIESTANAALKRWASLHKRRNRDREHRFLIEGSREVAGALAAGLDFEAVLVGDHAAPSDAELARVLALGGAAVYELGEAALKRVSFRTNPAALITVAATPAFSAEALELPATPLVLIADGVEKPGNLGAMIRSADGAGVDAILATDAAIDLVNPNVIRSSLGAVFAAPLAATTGAAAGDWLASRGVETVVARDDARVTIWEVDLTGPTAIVIGSEDAGPSPAWDGSPAVSIPMHGMSDSLNASVAAALVIFEAVRQRRAQKQ